MSQGKPKNHFLGVLRNDLIKIILSDLVVQFYNKNKSCQKCNFKQYWFPWSTFQEHCSPSRSRQNSKRFEKFKDKINLIDKNISDLITECFSRDKSFQKWYFKQLMSQWKISLFAIFSYQKHPKLIKLTNLMIFKIWYSYFQ